MAVKLLEVLLMLAMALLVIDVVWGVFTRDVLEKPSSWTEELARFLLIWTSLLGGALAFHAKGHLGVDYFVQKFHPEVRKLAEMFSHLVVLFFGVSVFVIGGTQIVRDALVVEQTTPALGWMMGYVYLVLPISGIFMCLFTLDNLVTAFRSPVTSEEGVARG